MDEYQTLICTEEAPPKLKRHYAGIDLTGDTDNEEEEFQPQTALAMMKKAREALTRDIKSTKEAEKAKKASNKRLMSACKFAITIAKCSAELVDVLDALQNKFGDCKYYVVQEKHKDGTPHIHAYIQVAKRKQIYSNRLTIRDRSYVCNYKQAYKSDGWQKYISKDVLAPFLTNIVLGGIMARETPQSVFEALKMETGSEVTAMVKFPQVISTWETLRKRTSQWTSTYSADSFKIPKPIIDWAEKYITNYKKEDGRRNILFIHGKSRLGKTQAMRHYFPDAAYSRGFSNPRIWSRINSSVMILDDLEDTERGGIDKPPNKAWTDVEIHQLKGKYTKMLEIQPRAVIILSNDRPMWLDLPYWKLNCTYVHVTNKFY